MSEKQQQENSIFPDNESALPDINTDDNIAGTNRLNYTVDEDETEKLKEELADQKDKYLRLFAEFDNFKRRNAKERIELIQTAGKEIITSLLEVLDDCDRAEKMIANSEDVKQIKEGIQLVFNKFRNTLQQKGLKTMNSIGEEFNSDIHEAISEVPAPKEEMKGKIIDEVEKGYSLNDKIIRFAKVIVGK